MLQLDSEKIAALRTLIAQAHKIAVTSHVHPDGDALGCSCALLHYLQETARKEAFILLPDEAPESLRFITKGVKEGHLFSGSAQASDIIPGCDLVFCLDCNGFSRTEALEPLFSASPARKVLVDHHVGPDRDSFDLVFSETEISSASELLYYILTQTGDPLPLSSATALMAGMTTDTNNFANSVYPSTLAMASDLLARGVNRDAILDALYHSGRENRLRLMGFLLSERLHITPSGAAWMVLTQDDLLRFDIQEGETEGFVNLPLSVRKVRISLLLKQEGDVFRVSIRSRKDVSARSLATAYFHGGGHEQASGGKVLIGQDIPTAEGIEPYLAGILQTFLS